MRKTFLFSFLAIVFFMASAPESTAQVKSNVIRVNLFSLAVGTGSLFYERALNDKLSAQMQGFYTSMGAGDVKYAGWGVTPEIWYYPGNEAPTGFYLGPFLRYTNFTLSEEVSGSDWRTRFTSVGGGVLIGYQVLIGEFVALDMFFGPKYTSTSISVESGQQVQGRNAFGRGGIWFRSGLAVGIAF